MSRFLDRSAMFDAFCRFWNMVLFVLLLPFVLVLSLRRESGRLVPDDSLPKYKRTLPKAA